MTIRYSVIIPNLHSPRIGEVLQALCRQTGIEESYEVIVVGRDKFGQVREEGPVRFLRSERDLNPAEARNRGIAAARGELLFFLDADCIPREDWMKWLLKAWREGRPVVGGSLTFDPRDNFWTLADNISHCYTLHVSGQRGPAVNFHISAANLCLEKKVVEEVGNFDEKLVCGEDFDLAMRLRKKGYDLYFEPAAVVTHRPTRDSFRSILRHSASWAPYSVIARHQHADLLKTPAFLYRPNLLLILSPLVAAWVTARIFVVRPAILKYWYTSPVIFFSKWAWCLAFAKGLRGLATSGPSRAKP